MSLKKLKKYILFVYLAVLIIFITCISFLYFYMREKSERTAIQEQEELTNQYSEQIDNMLVNMDNIALLIMQDTMFLETYKEAAESYNEDYFEKNIKEKFLLLQKLQSFYTTNKAAERISIYNGKSDYLSYGILYESNDLVEKFLENTDVEKIMDKISKARYGKRIIDIQNDERGEDEKLVSVKRNLMNIGTGEIYGVIDIEHKLSNLTKIFDTQDNGKNIILMDSNNNIVYSTENIKNIEKLKKNIEDETKKDFFITWKKGEKIGWTVVVEQSESTLLSAFRTMSYSIMFFAVAFLIINLILVTLFINKLMHPLEELSQSVSNVSLDNMKMSLKNEEHMDEISRINKEFDSMFRRLSISIENEMRYHFEALQAQMNPHFLYNTLSVISAEAIQDNAEKIPELCDHLAKMLRYTSDYEKKEVTLKEELDYCRDYLSLMEERYQSKLLYQIQTKGDLKKVKIPKISIQPLLENCFKHGFAEKAFPWKIFIFISVDEETWRIEIKDNGVGTSGEKIRKILQDIDNANAEPKKIGGLGLVNTIYRLKISYEDNVYYKILSQQERAFSVIMGGRVDDKSNDCRG